MYLSIQGGKNKLGLKDEGKREYIILSEADKIVLESYKTMVEGLADYLGNGYEFVVHSLENLDRSAIKIINGHHSGRVEGAPITDLALSMLGKINESKDSNGFSYFNKNKQGVVLKSATIPIKGEKDRIIGLLCINFYTDTPFSLILKNFFSEEKSNLLVGETSSIVSENFAEDIDDLIFTALAEAKEKVLNNVAIGSINKNKEIITLLYNKGIFNLKDAVIKVAELLRISKNTVYMHIRNLNEKED